MIKHYKMDSKIDPFILDGVNYSIWETDMEALLKSKFLWQYMKNAILDLSNYQVKFFIDGKKDEVIRIITSYICQEI